jgi:L-aminopeptidase/D-esterase-like protein
VKSNELLDLKPQISNIEPMLEFDFHEFKIGSAEYKEGPTGCTVIYFPKGAGMAVDIRGGSPGVHVDYPFWTNAICLAGGSILGHEAAAGVAVGILKENGYEATWGKIPLVPSAIIYDFPPNREDGNSIYPDKQLGRAAFDNAVSGRFPLGNQGAGIGATVGKFIGTKTRGGQGAAFKRVGAIKIFACTVLNAMGVIMNRDGEIVQGKLTNEKGEEVDRIIKVQESLGQIPFATKTGNTTLTVVVTNVKLERTQLDQLARQVHSSMAKMIDPFSTEEDGDVLFLVSTNELKHEKMYSPALGMVITDVLWDAVLSAFPEGVK